MTPAPPIVLCIAGSDPSGGAGVQADLRTIAVHGLHGAAVITGHTVQSGLGVSRVVAMDAALVWEQLATLLRDLPVAAIKIGMLGDGRVAEAIADGLQASEAPIVLDPVLVSSSGASLLDAAGARVLRERLVPRAALVTPNLMEAAELGGGDAGALAARYGVPFLVTGGHGDGDEVRDVLAYGAERRTLSAARIQTAHDRGTGCLLSTSIACALARGVSLLDAVQHGRACVRQGLRDAVAVGEGRGPARLLRLPEVSAVSDRSS